MNPALDSLGSIIEFSVGIAGFSAIVSAFLQRAGGLDPISRFRVLNLLLMALSPAFAAFLYVGLSQILADQALVLRWCAGIYALWYLLFLSYIQIGGINVSRDQPGAIHRPIYFVMVALACLNVVIQSLLAAGVIPAQFAVFYFGLVLSLGQAVVMFIRLLLSDNT